MYVLIAGGGKAGANVMRTLLRNGHEATIIEQDRDRYERLENEFEHQAMHGDATELFVLEKAGIKRPPDLVLALTGDDEDNLVITQLAKEKYGVPKVIARVNDPRNQAHFDLLGISPTVCATSSILGARRARGARTRPDPPARAAQGEPRDRRGADRQSFAVRRQARREAAAARGRRVYLRHARRQGGDRRRHDELKPGDQVLAILQPGKEDELRQILLKK